ncbi:MAG: hypothetical protein JNM59_07370 [Hyphomonadaceae bacterium]|nr:hypothetical protein [Hyphomonadaceae bacterium]
MAELSPVEAALYAFKRRERRFVLTRAAIGYLLLRLTIGAAFLAIAWPLLSSAMSWYLDAIGSVANGGVLTAPPWQTLSALAPLVIGSGLLSMLVLAAFEAACLRWLVRNETSGFLGLGLGADTWRVFALYWIWFLCGLIFLALVVAFYVALRAVSGLHAALGVVTVFVGALAPLGLAALVIWAGVRLSPAAALSIAYKRLVFLDAWKATRGKFWPALGAFVLVIVGYIIAATILDAILRIPFATVLTPVWHDVVLNNGDPENLLRALRDTFSQPQYIAFGLLYAAVIAAVVCVFYVAYYGVNARLVKAAEEERAGVTPASS